MMPKNSLLLLIAHGSRLNSANEEIRSLAKDLEKKIGCPVVPTFLELAQPSILEGIDLAIQGGYKDIVVFPYFLTQGRHVSEDVPKILEEKMKHHLEIKFRILPYLGKCDALVDFIASIVLK
jgi:sirohydrochlorin ferrochelatase